MIHHVKDSLDLVTQVWPGRRDVSAVVLLHGSGGDETSLVGFARAACPDRTLIAVRGRIPWEGGFAHFARHADRTLDHGDLALAAVALQHLLLRLRREGKEPPVLLGYSNGAILAAAVLALDHRLTSAAVLLRPLSPWAEQDVPRLPGHPVLVVTGVHDQRRDPRDGPLMAQQLRAAGARTTTQVLDTGHPLTPADEGLVGEWLQVLDPGPGDGTPSR